jgi:hypothetical protein
VNNVAPLLFVKVNMKTLKWFVHEIVRACAVFYYTQAVKQINPSHPDSHFVSRRLDHWRNLV